MAISQDTWKHNVRAVGFLKVTERAAIESARWLGRGDNHAADQAAVDAMRAELGAMPINGTVVIGEGQKDEAPELYVGEVLGDGGMTCEIAVDPLEGTDLVARGNAVSSAMCAKSATRSDCLRRMNRISSARPSVLGASGLVACGWC